MTLKRSPMKRSTKRMKSRGPKMTPIRASACNEECTLRFPGICNYRTDTTVLCHENGAGAGMKSLDEKGAYGCYECHMTLDGHKPRPAGFTRELMLALFVEANAQTRRILTRKGLIGVKNNA
jgi:hypothetical protein